MASRGDDAGQAVEVVVTDMASGGDAVGRDASGRAVFVTGALPGERVRAVVRSQHRRYARAEVVAVLEPSPQRRRPPCPELERGCGACPWQHVAEPYQRTLKDGFVVSALERAGIRCEARPVVELEPWAFRTTVAAAVVGGRAGFRRARSHRVVPVEGCLVAHPRLAELIVAGRFGAARKVLLRCGARTGERLAVTTPAGVACDLPADVRADHVHEVAAGRRWRISARSFFQTRPDGVDALAALVAAAADELGAPGRAVDLYAGVGVFAGVLAARGWTVTAVEGSTPAVADAVVNVAGLPVSVVRADVTGYEPPRADLVVADPSRAGLGKDGVAAVVATGARRVVLISCDVASLGRDASLLSGSGYAATAVTPVDLFPQTFRLEAVTVFDRLGA